MARPKVIIADEDASYIVPLQFKFVTDFFNKIDLEIILIEHILMSIFPDRRMLKF